MAHEAQTRPAFFCIGFAPFVIYDNNSIFVGKPEAADAEGWRGFYPTPANPCTRRLLWKTNSPNDSSEPRSGPGAGQLHLNC
jgi:hypothetical protein